MTLLAFEPERGLGRRQITTTIDGLLSCPALQVRQLNRILSQVYDQALEPVQLTSVQFGILSSVLTHPRSGMAALAQVVGVDPTTLKRLLEPLVDRGLVSIERPRKGDRRFRSISATFEGRSAVEHGIHLWRQATKELRQELGADRLGEFRRVVVAVLRKLRPIEQDED